jgi:hypothetical protein
MHMKLLAVFQMEDGNYRLPRKILYICKVASLPLEVTLRHCIKGSKFLEYVTTSFS